MRGPITLQISDNSLLARFARTTTLHNLIVDRKIGGVTWQSIYDILNLVWGAKL